MRRILTSILSLSAIAICLCSCDRYLPYNNRFFQKESTYTHKDTSQSIEVGDIIKFGHWEQDGDYDNGEEEIEWIILDVSNGKYLALSKYALDYDIYSYEDSSTFEKSAISEFMEDDFAHYAFNYLEEKKLVSGTLISDSGTYTPKDPVFALSKDELDMYSDSIPDIYSCYPTPAIADDVFQVSNDNDDDKGKCYWWVRDTTWYGTVVSPDGVGWVWQKASEEMAGIRPAIWLDFNFTVQVPTGININSKFLGKWYVSKGPDNFTITVFDNGEIWIDNDKDDPLNYICYSPNEIAVETEGLVFVLNDDEITMYDEYEWEDIYVFKKQ